MNYHFDIAAVIFPAPTFAGLRPFQLFIFEPASFAGIHLLAFIAQLLYHLKTDLKIHSISIISMSNKKIKQLYKILHKRFGPQRWWPTISKNKRFEICIGAILTQNTSWKNVEKVIENLDKNNLLTQEAIKKVNKNKLAKLIKPAGYYNQKARKLKVLATAMDKALSREELLALWGIGPETADSILCYAYSKPVFVVDAYTKRIFSRFGFKELGYDGIQKLVMNEIKSAKELNEFHALLVGHAKTYCQKKPLCIECPLGKDCNFTQ